MANKKQKLTIYYIIVVLLLLAGVFFTIYNPFVSLISQEKWMGYFCAEVSLLIGIVLFVFHLRKPFEKWYNSHIPNKEQIKRETFYVRGEEEHYYVDHIDKEKILRFVRKAIIISLCFSLLCSLLCCFAQGTI